MLLQEGQSILRIVRVTLANSTCMAKQFCYPLGPAQQELLHRLGSFLFLREQGDQSPATVLLTRWKNKGRQYPKVLLKFLTP